MEDVHNASVPRFKRNNGFDCGVDQEAMDNFENLQSCLDSCESNVDQFRKAAARLEQDKLKIVAQLESVSEDINTLLLTEGHREEIQATLSRLDERCSTVKIEVNTPRTEDQKLALSTINSKMETLEIEVQAGCVSIFKSLKQCYHACQAEPRGPVDLSFQTIVLSCAADDQKQIKKKLLGWIECLEDVINNGS